jgi:hypothetical protein
VSLFGSRKNAGSTFSIVTLKWKASASAFLETLEEPDGIQKGDFGDLLAIRLYPKTPLIRKYLVVVYREISL